MSSTWDHQDLETVRCGQGGSPVIRHSNREAITSGPLSGLTVWVGAILGT